MYMYMYMYAAQLILMNNLGVNSHVDATFGMFSGVCTTNHDIHRQEEQLHIYTVGTKKNKTERTVLL